MANKTYKCPSCGAKIVWAPMAQKMKCPYCESEFTLEQFEAQEQQVQQDLDTDNYQTGQEADAHSYQTATDDSNINPQDLRVYRCGTCGAEVVTDRTTVATSCAFCGNPVMLTEQLDTNFRPKWIIPFKIDQSQVKEIYLNYLKSRPFTPRKFSSDSYIEKIKAIYIPFWMYDLTMQGYIQASGEHTSTYADPRFIYTRHKVYDIERAGTVNLKQIPVDGSSKTPDDAMDSIEPFNYQDLVPFKMAYLSGFMAERYDQDDTYCLRRAEVRARKTMQTMLQQTISGYGSVNYKNANFGVQNAHVEYGLLPVYMLFTRHLGKDYFFAMNGQTGKAVGDVPTSGGRMFLYWLLRFLLISGIAFAVIFLFLHVL